MTEHDFILLIIGFDIGFLLGLVLRVYHIWLRFKKEMGL